MKNVQMSLGDVLTQLEAWGDEKARANYAKRGAGVNQFGVGIVKLHGLAKKLKRNHQLAMELWNTGNTDAMILATMIMDATELSIQEIKDMIKPITYSKLIDEFVYNVIIETTFAAKLAEEWMNTSEEFVGRAGWNIMIANILDGKTVSADFDAILKKIQDEMKSAPQYKQESMNRCLCEIGIHFPEFTEKCIEIGERVGILDDKPVHKGCTSSFAPEWIRAAINKKKQ